MKQKRQQKRGATEKVVLQELIVKPPLRRPWDVGDWRSALRSADNGRVRHLYELYDDMLIDGVLSDAVDKRKQAVLNAPLIFVNSKGREVDEVTALIDTMGWEDLIASILDARFFGRSGVEIELTSSGLESHTIHPKHIDLSTQSVILDFANPDKKVSYLDYPSVIVVGKERDLGLLLKAVPYAIYKRGGFGDWSQWIELFGMPQRIGKYNTYDPESKRLLERALEEAGSASYVVIPEGSSIDIRETRQSSGSSFNEFRQACNEEILISILGQTLTTISGEKGARSLGEVHRSVEEDKNRSDIKFVQRTLNSLVLPLLEARGVRGVAGGQFLYPEDAKEISVPELVQLATILPIPTSYLYDKYGIPTPEAGEEIAGRTNDTSKASDVSDPSDPSDKSDESDESDSPRSPQLKDFPSAPQVGAEPAEPKKRSWFRRLTNSITARLKLSDDGYSIDLNKLLAEAIKEVYGGEVELSRNLFQIQNDALQQAVDKTMSEPEFGRLNSEFVEEFRYNTAVFSAFKAHAETEAMVALLTKEDGSLRSFWEFKKLAKKLSPKWNEQWLRTEYNTAVRSARSAVNYRNALRMKDLYPNLEYIASTAKDKRPDHLEYVGAVLPIEHPWWDTHLPPSEWNCKCSVRPTDKPTTKVPKDSGTPPTFQNNLGKTAEFVKLKEHPYLRGKGVPTCPECRRQWLVKRTNSERGEDMLCSMHRKAMIIQKLQRYKGWRFYRTNYKDGGCFEKPKGQYQNLQEQDKNERALQALAEKSRRRLRALPVITDGDKNQDAIDLLTGELLDVKVPDKQLSKSALTNGIRSAHDQKASEVLIDARHTATSKAHLEDLLSRTLIEWRYFNVKYVSVLMPDGSVLRYETEKYHREWEEKQEKKGRR